MQLDQAELHAADGCMQGSGRKYASTPYLELHASALLKCVLQAGAAFSPSGACVGLCYAADMLLSLHVGFVVTYNLQKKTVLNGRKIAKFYLASGHLILDMLSVIPWIAQASLCL